MRKSCLALALVGGMMAAQATPAMADGTRSYNVCGGDQFKTCAAVEVSVVGSNVTMRIWNMSGQYGSRAGTVFDAVGIYNLPAGISLVAGSGNVTGPARPGDSPSNWNFQNSGKVNFGVDIKTDTPGPKTALTNGIASGCATAAELPGSPPNLYMNPCSTDTSNPLDFVTFTFSISGGTFDPMNTDIVFRGYDAISGETTECWTGQGANGAAANCTPVTATPEPVTLTLLATGLVGMSGAGFFRRRRQQGL